MSEKAKPFLNLSSLGNRLELFRNSKGLKKTEAGRLAGVSSQTIDDWEKGKVAPHLLSYLVLLAENFNCDLNLLILGREVAGKSEPGDWKDKYYSEVEAHRNTYEKLLEAKEKLEASVAHPTVLDMGTVTSIFPEVVSTDKERD